MASIERELGFRDHGPGFDEEEETRSYLDDDEDEEEDAHLLSLLVSSKPKRDSAKAQQVLGLIRITTGFRGINHHRYGKDKERAQRDISIQDAAQDVPLPETLIENGEVRRASAKAQELLGLITAPRGLRRQRRRGGKGIYADTKAFRQAMGWSDEEEDEGGEYAVLVDHESDSEQHRNPQTVSWASSTTSSSSDDEPTFLTAPQTRPTTPQSQRPTSFLLTATPTPDTRKTPSPYDTTPTRSRPPPINFSRPLSQSQQTSPTTPSAPIHKFPPFPPSLVKRDDIGLPRTPPSRGTNLALAKPIFELVPQDIPREAQRRSRRSGKIWLPECLKNRRLSFLEREKGEKTKEKGENGLNDGWKKYETAVVGRARPVDVRGRVLRIRGQAFDVMGGRGRGEDWLGYGRSGSSSEGEDMESLGGSEDEDDEEEEDDEEGESTDDTLWPSLSMSSSSTYSDIVTYYSQPHSRDPDASDVLEDEDGQADHELEQAQPEQQPHICPLCSLSLPPSAFPIRQSTQRCTHAPHICFTCVKAWVEEGLVAGGDVGCPECGEGMGWADCVFFMGYAGDGEERKGGERNGGVVGDNADSNSVALASEAARRNQDGESMKELLGKD
ncbi:hypothetical protein M011DRAFT_474251 [Sporormia fimetaria CBS 119925]|uniref:RING-type domain-containing protein n=1 Tax=Sporormia fimetaria CBS 119925 TaxID=1340428 RepID=A0A6A6VLS3_9PLEO|nr:hypothetical protein M011DRAFT_474251 [Sporormia fimetaria CBS 119925]